MAGAVAAVAGTANVAGAAAAAAADQDEDQDDPQAAVVAAKTAVVKAHIVFTSLVIQLSYTMQVGRQG